MAQGVLGRGSGGDRGGSGTSAPRDRRSGAEEGLAGRGSENALGGVRRGNLRSVWVGDEAQSHRAWLGHVRGAALKSGGRPEDPTGRDGLLVRHKLSRGVQEAAAGLTADSARGGCPAEGHVAAR
jgi:hypothetical protein